MQSTKINELKRGVLVFLGLAVLTIIEYYLGTHQAAPIFLWVVALLKAGLVLVYFMHIGRVFGSEGEH